MNNLNLTTEQFDNFLELLIKKNNLTKEEALGKINNKEFYYLDLSGVDLRNADLRNSYLTATNLINSDLRRAYLIDTDLRGADLTGAKLRGAYLIDTDLRYAFLEGVDLRGSDLEGACLEYANLRNADLRGTCLENTYLKGVNLRNSVGNMEQIKSMQLQNYMVTYTKDKVFIGCQEFNINEFCDLNNKEIIRERLDDGEINISDAKLFFKYREYLVNTIKLFPAK